MTFSELQKMFNRAFWLSFSKKKLLFAFSLLAICGVLIVFCRALALGTDEWVAMSLTFLPIFLTSGILLAAGIVLTRLYHDDIKKRPGQFRQTVRSSWDLMLSTSYLALPLLLAYLILWIGLGIFFLLKAIPGLGAFISSIFAFGPFILILGSLLLSLVNLLLLFFVTPTVALSVEGRAKMTQLVLHRLRGDLFGNILLLAIALLPALFVVLLAVTAAYLTGWSYLSSEQPLAIVVQWFLIMLPFAALLAPAVVFFFQFAAEAHVLVKQKSA